MSATLSSNYMQPASVQAIDEAACIGYVESKQSAIELNFKLVHLHID